MDWGVSQQDLLIGGVTGLTYAALAAGFVLVYRASGILNFAHADVGALCAATFVLMLAGYGLNWWMAFAVAIVGGFIVGGAIELTIIRRLSQSSRLVLLIATIGVGQLLVLARINLPPVLRPGPIPPPFDLSWQVTDDLRILGRDLIVLISVPVMVGVLGLVLHKTRFGLATRASAANPDTARTFGIPTRRISTALWGIAGSLSAATAVFFAPLEGVSAAQTGTAALAPPLLLRALVVSLLARMRSLPMTLVGRCRGRHRRKDRARQRGVGQPLDRRPVPVRRRGGGGRVRGARPPGRGRLVALAETPGGAGAVRASTDRAPPGHHRTGRDLLFLGLLGWLLDSPTALWLWTGILIHTMVALSLTLLTGWAGQISLGQFAFVGLGAFSLVALTKGHDIPIPLNLFDLSLQLNWGTAVVLSTLLGALAALIIGVPALRVRGLFLAVATLAFAVASANWILAQDVFTGGTTAVRPVTEPVLGPFDFGASRKSFYFLCLGFLVVVTVLLARLRHTGIGRSMLAVRENEEMAAASTVSITRMKILGFAIAGAVAALAGALYGTLQENLSPANTFAPAFSIDVVAISVIGGLGSIAGPFLGVLWVKGIPALFDPTAPPESIRLLTSGIGLLLLLLYLPGGLVQFLYNGRDALLRMISRSRFGASASPERPTGLPVATLAAPRRPAVPASPIWLRTQGLSVSFGGNRAVRDVDFEVRRGELVGLIGTNGAGKSTLMNAVSGFVPSSGSVEILGHDVSGLSAHERHRRGLGRTFQSARLYPDLTVSETLMVALEARRQSLLVPSLLGIPPSPGAERQKRAEATELVDYLGLGNLAAYFVSELSTGTRHVVELGCMLASGARVLLFDEPTGGLSQREAEEFGPRIKEVQAELGAAVVVIEHNVPLVMGISDRMYCLEAGAVIAMGTPAEVRADPAVIASYLGTDERASGRSLT